MLLEPVHVSRESPEESSLGAVPAGDVDDVGKGGTNSRQVSRSHKANSDTGIHFQLQTFEPLT